MSKTLDEILDDHRAKSYYPRPFEPDLRKWEEKYKQSELEGAADVKEQIKALFLELVGEDYTDWESTSPKDIGRKQEFENNFRQQLRDKINQL